MAFRFWDQLIVVIEYDGAYWHEGREDGDRGKSEAIASLVGPAGEAHEVVRVREQPLSPLSDNDIAVPKRADAKTCARLVLLHLAHLFFAQPSGHDVLARIDLFLQSYANPGKDEDIWCRRCWPRAEAIKQEHREPLPASYVSWFGNVRYRRRPRAGARRR
ncbi:hypothetical protein [Kutzneria buriramensis]|uniref:hypothetical protein n=1 Tax=Kutzneria buriramensis TaxID=1045776 RepID=UPI000E242423|nr:hypothetical protein [Kutzneria buriramensis]